MSNAERHTIDELVTRYQFEKNLKDIYVEGAQDKGIVEAVLEEHQISDVKVFEVSSVHVPADPGEEANNRTRLVKLARMLLEGLKGERVRLACIIDSDFDHLTGTQEQHAFLVKTDYADMEMYFFSPLVIDKMNRRCLGRRRVTEHMRKAFMIPTLQFLFRVRYVHSMPAWKLKERAPPFERLISFSKGCFSFDGNQHIKRHLNKNDQHDRRSEFEQEVEAVALPAEADARCFMNGHDFLTLLRRMLRCLKHGQLGRGVGPKDEDLLFSMLRACADYELLAKEPLFAAILQRFR